jgi:RNA polymerase sigma factor (sigma-70 family)
VKEGLTAAEVDALYRRYGFFIRRRCRLLLKDPALADDAVQEAFVNVLRRGNEMRQAAEPLRFLYRVADRACFDQLRNAQRRQPWAKAAAGEGALEETPCHPGADPDARRIAIELLASLDPESQQIAVMAFVDGMTQDEIAVELGYSRMTIIKRVAAIRAAAKKRNQESLP